MKTSYDICFVTVGDRKNADEIASGLLKERLAACVTVVPGLESSYWWKDRIEKSSEIMLIIKTRRTLQEDIIQFVKQRHAYAVPEIIFTEINGAAKDYLDWVGANTLFTSNIPLDKAMGAL